MCGIAGFASLDGAPADATRLRAMLATLRHRGPDDRGEAFFSLRNHDTPDAALGFQRLKIIDLSEHGHQPMANAGGTIIVALNGEVYNAFDFTSELEAAGYRFRSRTDTEVLLYLYERDGLTGMLDRLNGMFAIVIVDLRTRRIHLARDHFGIKPLYWTQIGARVLFASESKAFLADPGFAVAIDERHVDEQLAFRYVSGDGSLLEGVRQVRPGHSLTISPNGIETRRYWSIPDVVAKPAVRRDHAVEQFGDVLAQSVRAHLIGDVPIGCQLSGGIDSSLVTTLAQPAQAFSVVFDDPKFSEGPWIDTVVASANIASERLVFRQSDFIGPLQSAAWHMDQPISHPNALGLWLLAKSARDRVTVLLTGEGADEVFGGYSRFCDARYQSRDAFIRATQFQPASKLARLRPGADLAPALARRTAIFDDGRGDFLSNCLKYEMQTYMVDLLQRQDRMTMAHGVENRVPLLDRRLVEFARSLPARHLAGVAAGEHAVTRSTKIVVKELARRRFGDDFAYRPKAAFALPLSQYFRSAAFTELMEDQLLPGMRRRGLVSEPAVRELWRRSLSAPALTEVLWIPVALELWAQQIVDRRGFAA